MGGFPIARRQPQILDDGVLTDSQGRKVDFKNTIIIMSSNVSAKLISNTNAKSLGFSGSDNGGVMSNDEIYSAVMGELKKCFRPEFLNRVDDIIVCEQLKKDDIKEIAHRLLKNLSKRVDGLGIGLEFDASSVEQIADAGFDPVYGARPLRRAIQSQIEDKLSEEMLENRVVAGKKYTCVYENGEYLFKEI